ncbi:MAG: hypothetical protein WCQ99_05645 [Pseudomonadota bacterium]
MAESIKTEKDSNMQTKMILTDEQYRVLSRKLVNAIESNYKTVPLNTLKHSKYTLKKPVYITIEKDKNIVIAALDDIEAFAYADTEFEAINNLCVEIITIYEDLKSDRRNLGKLPQKWLEYLEEIIRSR